MKVIRLTSAYGLKSALSAANTYFIVESDITLEGTGYTLGSGSVIEFDGGSFRGVTGSSLNLNHSQIVAPPYPIFSNVEVSSFACEVRAEWFNENGNTPTHIFVNKALVYAKGCPVVLEDKTYLLTGTITFPANSDSTLICPGTLHIDPTDDNKDAIWRANPVAIDINTNNVHLDINKISVKTKSIDSTGNVTYGVAGVPEDKPFSGQDYVGTGIRFSGQVFSTTVNVNILQGLNRGIVMSPGIDTTDGSQMYAYLQYLSITFQYILADYCIYMDLYSHGTPSLNRITLSQFYGGRLRGFYGIYMTEDPSSTSNNRITALRFENIGLEGMHGTALYLRNASRLSFENIRMEEDFSLTHPWVDCKNVAWVTLDAHGGLDADKFKIEGSCYRIKATGTLLKYTLREGGEGWSPTYFDTLTINLLWAYDSASGKLVNKAQKAACYSVSPYAMTKVMTASSTLQQSLPLVMEPVAGKFDGLAALAGMLQVKSGSSVTLDLNNLPDFAPCIYYILVESGAKLKLTQNAKSAEVDGPSERTLSSSTLGAGLYHIMWNNAVTNGNLIDVKVK